jgi:hypothetical protein
MFSNNQPKVQTKEYEVKTQEEENAVLRNYGHPAGFRRSPLGGETYGSPKKEPQNNQNFANAVATATATAAISTNKPFATTLSKQDEVEAEKERKLAAADGANPIISSIFDLSHIPIHYHHKYHGLPYITDLEGNDIFLEEDIAENYFGTKARKSFFTLFSKMNYNKYNIVPSIMPDDMDDEDEFGEYGEGEDGEGSTARRTITGTTASRATTADRGGDRKQSINTINTLSDLRSIGDNYSIDNSTILTAPSLMLTNHTSGNHHHHDDNETIISSYFPELQPLFVANAAAAASASSFPGRIASSSNVALSFDHRSRLTNPHFFDDLQSFSSNDCIKQSIDSQILSKKTKLPIKKKKAPLSLSSNVSLAGSSHVSSIGGIGGSRRVNLRKMKNHRNNGGIRLKPLGLSASTSQLPSSLSSSTPSTANPLNLTIHVPSSSSASSSSSVDHGKPKENWELLTETRPSSPRTCYLSACIREGIQPLPNIIIRKKYTTILDLSHFGIGDTMGKILAECLKDLPSLEMISLNDNNLTDTSLQYLIDAIAQIPSLKVLNLSRNKIDGYSATALSNYVRRSDCPLITLILQNADVDDGECDNFVQTLISNEQLLELDLSSNLLGSAETLSSFDKNTKTGGEALAEYLSSSCCRLKILKLAWNNIRLKSAWSLLSSLSINSTITYLDLNSNGLGSKAGEILGDALMENRTLKTLLVNNNNFTSTACISLCIGVVENMALQCLEMNENPIGLIGARMIMQISTALGTRISLSCKNCNTVTVDSSCWYDPSIPYGEFTLHLSQPFERAIAFHLLQIIASHATYIFEYFYHEADSHKKGGNGGGGGGKKEKLTLIQSISKDREQYLNSEQLQYLSGLKTIYNASTNLKLAEKLFYEADEDNSGKLDKYELSAVLEKIGFHIDNDHLQDLFLLFDIDGTGMIDLSEFLSLLKSQQRETLLRIKELTEYPMMALETTPSIKYIPPKTGILHCKIVDGFIQKSRFYTFSSLDSKYAINMAKGIGDMSLLSEAVKHNKIRYNEALSMFKTIYKDGERNKSKILLRILPQMMYTTEALQLLSKITNDSYPELQRIKMTFGISLKPLLGLYNGYYVLDLSKEIHRVCLSRLLEQSGNICNKRNKESIIKSGKVGDTSQHQNWTCFRNELFNNQKIEITATRFTPMPLQGILSFDFVSCSRPSLAGELTISDKRLCKVLYNLCLLPSSKLSEGLHLLHSWKKRCQTTSQDKKLLMPIYSFPVSKALEIGRELEDFYSHLEERETLVRNGAKKEEIKVQTKRNMMERPTTRESSTALDDIDTVQQLMKENNKKRFDDNDGGDGDGDGNSTIAEESEEGGGGGGGDDDNTVMTNGTFESEEEEGDKRNGEGMKDDGGDYIKIEEDEETVGGDEEEKQKEVDDDESLILKEQKELEREEAEEEEEFKNLSSSVSYAEQQQNGGDAEIGIDAERPATGLGGEEQMDENSLELSANQQIKLRKRRIKEQKIRLYNLLYTRDISLCAKAIRFVEVIDETFNRLWILCRHLGLIIQLFQQLFPSHKVRKTTYYGSYAVEIIICLFNRIIDLHNFELLYELLSPSDCAALYGRLGLLNLFNPLKPEMTFELCLDRLEERIVAKIIIYLSVLEPGINIVYKRFQWKRELDPTPGWEVTDAMFTETGLYTHGYFAFTYYSGEGKFKMGCIPDVFARRALCQMVLINENEVYCNNLLFDREDDHFNNIVIGNKGINDTDFIMEYVNSSIKHYQQNMDLWLGYLVATPSSSY